MRQPLEICAAAPASEREVLCQGLVEVTAAEGEQKLDRFKMVAYNGGEIMQLWGKAVVDLAGVEVPAGGDGMPILYVHDMTCPIGHADKVTVDQKILAEGVFSVPCEERDRVVQAGKNGFKWQASIRGPITKSEYVEEGAKAQVNGKTVKGPITIVRGMKLKEISVTALGADEKTSTRVAASAIFGKELNMEFNEWLKAKGLTADGASEEVLAAYRKVWEADKAQHKPAAPVFSTLEAEAADLKRKQQIEAVALKYAKECPSSVDAIMQVAVAAAKDSKITAQDVELQCLRATRGQAPAEFHTFSRQQRIDKRAIEASMAISAKLPNIEKHYPAEVLNRASDACPRGMSITDALLLAAEERGVRMRSIRSDADIKNALRAAFPMEVAADGASTFSLSGILGNVQNKFLLESFMSVEQSWRAIAAIKPVRDFKAVTSYRMKGDMEFEEVGPDGQLRAATADEESFTNQAKTYGKLFGITRQDIINDDLSAFSRIGSRLGRGGALKLNLVFWTAFMNNSSFFTSARGNYWADAASVLAAASLKTAVTTFRKITDPDGKPKGLSPKILLVPVDLDITARELVTSITWNSGGSATTEQIPSRNVLATMGLVPVSTEYLSNSAITGYSTLAWYLLADPRDIAVMEVLFLNGQETPLVESADADFATLGIRFRGYFDFGCAKQEYRAGLKVKGAA